MNYISRRSSVIQLSPASPGLYYLRIECLKPLSSLELTTMIGDLDYLSKLEHLEVGGNLKLQRSFLQIFVQELEYLNEIEVK